MKSRREEEGKEPEGLESSDGSFLTVLSALLTPPLQSDIMLR